MEASEFVAWVALGVLLFAMGALALFMLHMLTVSESLSLLLLDVIVHKDHNKFQQTQAVERGREGSEKMLAEMPHADKRRLRVLRSAPVNTRGGGRRRVHDD